MQLTRDDLQFYNIENVREAEAYDTWLGQFRNEPRTWKLAKPDRWAKLLMLSAAAHASRDQYKTLKSIDAVSNTK